MKPWRDLSLTPLPARMARLPRDPRGYPIPVNVFQREGKLDFRVIDNETTAKLLKSRCCAMCGQPLGDRMAFVGGPSSITHRLFTDAPTHRECATYAIQVCPFLAAPSFSYRKNAPEKLSDNYVSQIDSNVSTDRPDFFGLGICKDFELVNLHGTVAIHAMPWKRLEWWQNGKFLEAAKPSELVS